MEELDEILRSANILTKDLETRVFYILEESKDIGLRKREIINLLTVEKEKEFNELWSKMKKEKKILPAVEGTHKHTVSEKYRTRYCEFCEQIYISNIKRKDCGECRQDFCNNCARKCSKCGKVVCPNHGLKCDKCRKVACRECFLEVLSSRYASLDSEFGVSLESCLFCEEDWYDDGSLSKCELEHILNPEYDYFHLELDAEASEVFIKLFNEPNPNAEKYHRRTEEMFKNIDINKDPIRRIMKKPKR